MLTAPTWLLKAEYLEGLSPMRERRISHNCCDPLSLRLLPLRPEYSEKKEVPHEDPLHGMLESAGVLAWTDPGRHDRLCSLRSRPLAAESLPATPRLCVDHVLACCIAPVCVSEDLDPYQRMSTPHIVLDNRASLGVRKGKCTMLGRHCWCD
jgi:hypothetical protein